MYSSVQIQSMSSVLVGTSLPQTLLNNVNIGENATHTITLTLPAGVMTMSVTVLFPTGVLARNASVVSIGAQITPASQVIVLSNIAQVTFSFGTCVNVPDGVVNAADNIVLQVRNASTIPLFSYQLRIY